MKLKVCGMKYQDNIKAVAALQPDYLGFIFHEKSARYFKGDLPAIPSTIKKVGVFVDADLKEVIKLIKTHKLQIVQLHGSESPEYCKNLKSQGVEIIKVFSIKDQFDFDNLKPYESVCGFYLFDTKGKLPGGNGYTFDWTVLKNYTSSKPYFLSGGIGLQELENIKAFLNKKESKLCHAIDVNSQFETAPGLKNIEKLKEFKSQL